MHVPWLRPWHILVVALVLRLAMFVAVGSWDPVVERDVIIKSDSRLYHELASHLAHTGRFYPEPIRTPGYLIYVAALYAAVGESAAVVIFSQILLDLLVCFLCYLLARRIFGERAGLAASLLYALDPAAILFSNMLMSDTLFTLLLLGSALLLLRVVERSTPRDQLLGHAGVALLLGLAALTRPVALYFIAIQLGVILWKGRRRPALAVGTALLAGIIFTATIAPWVYRNVDEFGVAGLSSSGSLNLLYLYALPTEALRSKVSIEEAEERIYREGGASRDRLDTSNIYRHHQDIGRIAGGYIFRHPLSFAWATLVGTAQMYGNFGSGGYAFLLRLQNEKSDLKSETARRGLIGGVQAMIGRKSLVEMAILLMSLLFHVVEYLLVAIGLWSVRKRWREPRIAMLIGFIIFYSLLIGAAGLMRFKLPVVPLYAGIAGAGFVAAIDRRNFRRARETEGPIEKRIDTVPAT